MSVSEKEAVLRERAAFTLAARLYAAKIGDWIVEQAKVRFPLPKVTRRRVVRDPSEEGYEWSIHDGSLHFRWLLAAPDAWKCASGMYKNENLLLTPTRPRVAMWADLLANPTEEVDE